MSISKFEPKPLPDDEIRLAQELCVEMGECAATYHIVIQLGEIERLKQVNKEMYEALSNILIWASTIASLYPGHERNEGTVEGDIAAARAALAKAVKE
jgi:hypothetical protein